MKSTAVIFAFWTVTAFGAVGFGRLTGIPVHAADAAAVAMAAFAASGTIHAILIWYSLRQQRSDLE